MNFLRIAVILLLFTCFNIIVFGASLAHAHKISVFAWVEGDTIHTQSKFYGGKKIKNARIVIYDETGKQIDEGITDENGESSFPLGVKPPITIVVDAGMGHQGQWTIEKSDAGEPLVVETPANPPPAPSTGGQSVEPSFVSDYASNGCADVCEETLMQFYAVVDEIVDEKLSGMLSRLESGQDKQGPDMTQIFGGIGYIFGLAGVAAYVHSRRQNRNNH
ncbi:MAG: hypothetical protein HKM93_20350 [Desulfobacteraceae bacterium]|nr:hypothetical protein [Desulfobacteraceae bacterium]